MCLYFQLLLYILRIIVIFWDYYSVLLYHTYYVILYHLLAFILALVVV